MKYWLGICYLIPSLILGYFSFIFFALGGIWFVIPFIISLAYLLFTAFLTRPNSISEKNKAVFLLSVLFASTILMGCLWFFTLAAFGGSSNISPFFYISAISVIALLPVAFLVALIVCVIRKKNDLAKLILPAFCIFLALALPVYFQLYNIYTFRAEHPATLSPKQTSEVSDWVKYDWKLSNISEQSYFALPVKYPSDWTVQTHHDPEAQCPQCGTGSYFTDYLILQPKDNDKSHIYLGTQGCTGYGLPGYKRCDTIMMRNGAFFIVSDSDSSEFIKVYTLMLYYLNQERNAQINEVKKENTYVDPVITFKYPLDWKYIYGPDIPEGTTMSFCSNSANSCFDNRDAKISIVFGMYSQDVDRLNSNIPTDYGDGGGKQATLLDDKPAVKMTINRCADKKLMEYTVAAENDGKFYNISSYFACDSAITPNDIKSLNDAFNQITSTFKFTK